MAYDAGTAAIQIVPSFRGVQTLVDSQFKRMGFSAGKAFSDEFSRQVKTGTDVPAGPSTTRSRKSGTDNGGAFADGFRRRVEAALKNLPEPTIGVATTAAEQKLRDLHAELRRLSGQRIGIDIDEATAMAELARMRDALDDLGRQNPSIQVRTDVAGASAELAAFQAQVDLLDGRSIDVHVEDNGSIGRGVVGLSGLLASAVALAPALVPVGAAALGALGAIGPAAAAGGVGLGVMSLGFMGVADAVEALSDQQVNAAADAEKAARAQSVYAYAQLNAARQVESAEASLANVRASAREAAVRSAAAVVTARRGVAAAERDAADRISAALASVRQAEESHADAQQDVRRAQQDLTQARKDAKATLDDYQLSVRSAALSEDEAGLALERARERLREARKADPGGASLDTREAELAVKAAVLRLDEARDRNKEVQAEAKAAEKAGVDGAANVVQARERVAQARDGEREAAQRVRAAEAEVAKARVDGAERVAQAQRAVTAAIEAQTAQQRQSAHAVSQAQAQVTGALLAQQRAAEQTADVTSTSTEKVAEAMDALSPTGRKFAAFIYGLRDQFKALRTAAQGGLLPGVMAGITAVLPVMPKITRAVGAVATGMGELFRAAGEALASPFWQRFIGFVGDTAQGAIEGFGKVIGNLATGFAGLTMAFAPFARQLGAGLVTLTERFAEFGRGAGSNAFQDFLGYVQRVTPQVVATLGSIVRAVGHLLVALAPIGEVVLGLVKGFADLISNTPTPVLTALLAVAVTLTASIVAINAAVRAAAAAQVAWNGITRTAAAIQRFFFTTTVAATGAQRASTLSMIANRVAAVATSAAIRVWAAAQWLLNAALTANPIGIVVVAIAAFVGAIILAYKNSETFRDIVDKAWRVVRTGIQVSWRDYIKPALNALWDAVKFGWEQFEKFQRIASGVFDAFKEHVRTSVLKIADHFLGMAESVVNGIRPIAKLLGFGDEVDQAVKDIRRMRKGINTELDLIRNQNIKITVAAKGILAKNALRFANEHTARVAAGRAQGGALPGAPSTVDNMLAPVIRGGQTWLQPLAGGEHIVSAPEVQAAGGHTAVERWRRSLLKGRASGGPVFDIEPVKPSAADIKAIRRTMNYGISTITAGIQAAVKRAAEGMGTLSGGGFARASGGWPPPRLGVVSPNTAAAAAFIRDRWGVFSGLLGSRPNKSDHPYGKALDAMTSNVAKGNAIANHFVTNPAAFGTKYVIWRQQINSGSGWRGMEDRGSPTANHMDHVHVSLFDKGGYLPPGLSMVLNATGKPEPVLTNQQMSDLRAAAAGNRSAGRDRAMVEIGQMITANPDEALRTMERRQADAIAMANLRGI